MANTVFKLRRSSVAGKLPNTSTLVIGELALNLTDRILYSSDGSNVWEIGANNTTVNVVNSITVSTNCSINSSGFYTTGEGEFSLGPAYVANTSGVYTAGVIKLASNDKALSFAAVNASSVSKFIHQNDDNFVFYSTNTSYSSRPVWSIFANSNVSDFEIHAKVRPNAGIVANGSTGSSGTVLTSDGSGGLYWATVSGTGTVTSVDTGNGLTGGPFTVSGTLSVVANDGIIANSSGVFVKAGQTTVVNSSGVFVNVDSSYVWSNVHTFNGNIVLGSAGLSANGSYGNAGQSLLSNGSATYWATAGATLNANNTDNQTFYIGLSNASSGAWTNAVVATSKLSFVPSSGELTVGSATVNSTNYSGTANNTLFVGSVTADNVVSNSQLSSNVNTLQGHITSNASAAYTNAVSYIDASILTANAAITGNSATAYSNAVSYVDGLKLDSVTNTSINLIPVANTIKNVYDRAIDANTRAASAQTAAINAYSNAVSYIDGAILTANAAITGNSATAYSNAVSYVDGAILTANAAITGNAATAYSNAVSYIDGAILTANAAITGNAAAAYTNATLFASNASNINTGTIAEARLPYRIDQDVRTIDNVEFKNIIVSGNLTVAGTSTILQGNSITFSDNMLYLNQGINANITNISSNGTYVTFTANNNYQVGWDVDVSGVNPSSYNGTYLNIFSANSTTFIVANTNTDTYVSGGVARGRTESNPDIGFAAGYNDGTYHHTGFFRDATDGIWKVFDSYTPEPDVSPYIDTSNTSFQLSNFQANSLFLGNTSTNWFVANTLGITHSSNTTTFGTAVYVAANGNLGIGDSSPDDKLVVAGNIMPSIDNSYNLGSQDLRWANIFTGDLHLSNEKSLGNEIDGTTGNWTIQEGNDDLFIINNKNGKKYKFKLEEV
jgi:hypothetical protein